MNISSLKRLSKIASAVVIFVGGLVLLGWLFDIGILKTVLPGLVEMKINTALGLILSGVSLWLLQRDRVSRRRRLIAQAGALIVTLMGLLTLSEHLLGWTLGIDQPLFKDSLGVVQDSMPGRPSPQTSVNFVLIGLALLLDFRTRSGQRPAQVLALAAALVSLVVLVGYLYRITSFYAISPHTGMALHTMLSFMVLSMGLLFSHPDEGWMARITSNHVGGAMAQLLLPAAIGVPIILGWLRLLGQKGGFYDTESGVALLVVLTSVGFILLIGWSTRTLNQTDAERKQVEEKFRVVAETANDAIVTADSCGNITYFNKGAERMFGYSMGDVVGQPLTLLMPERLHDAHRQGFRRFLSTGEAHVVGKTVELVGRRKNRAEFPLELSLANWKTGEGTFFTAILRDITERKLAEEEMRKLNTYLKATNKELEAFSYSVSHDLRAPLRHVDGFSQILLEDYADKLDEPGRRYLQQVREASQQMAQLIDDLLNLSRVTRADMHREPVDLSQIAEQVAEELKKTQPDRSVEFVIEKGLMTEGDARLLGVLLDNLLSNAWKYTGKRPQARVEFGRTTRDGKAVYFVRDNGVGFDMAYVHKLFGAFQRLHTLTEFPGTGIGLATVQRIVQRYGGQVWADGVVGQGATFYFTL
ncbi:MAG: PAS domain S-box protein [Nitrospira sp.]|nr:PAS domain S-box protein [Nitrospira sp.]